MKAKKIKLWIAFLPLSPLILLIYIGIRWRKSGRLGFKKLWSQTSLYIVLGGFCTELLFFPASTWLMNVYIKDQSCIAAVLLILCEYISLTSASLVIREIEYKQLLKAKN